MVVELDFFGIEKINSQRSSIRGIQSTISRINPTMLRSVMEMPRTSAVAAGKSSRLLTPTMPVNETAPLTIFYNGTVSVFHVGRNEAEELLKLAAESSAKERMLDSRDGDLPMARKKSLRRFLENRKERLIAVGPFASENEDVGSANKKGRMELI